MSVKAMVDGVEMTFDAAECVESASADVRADVRAMLDGSSTAEALLSWCLDGADEESVSGWREYVEAIEAHVERVQSKARKAASTHLGAIGWNVADGETDAALGLGEEAWDSDMPDGWTAREWTDLCEEAVRAIARERRQEVAQ